MRRADLAALPLPVALALAAVLELALVAPPAPRPADAPADTFSALRAARHLEVIAREPHPVGTPANARVRDHLVTELERLGLETEVQRAAVVDRYGESRTATFARVENVIGVRRGAGGGPALLLMAHYDSRWNAPGAGDDGAGVATVLEAVRALGATPLERDLAVLFTDGEEAGLMGAQAFFGEHPLGKRVGLVLNFEARGSRGIALMFETSADNAALIAGFAASVPRPSATSLDYEAYRLMPNDTDLSVAKAAGLPAMNVALVGGFFDYHSPTDTAANFSPATLQHMGDYALALARHFGATPLPPPAAGDAAYFDLLGRVLVHYPVWLGHALTLLALAAFLALVARAVRAGRADTRGAARGALAFGLAIATVALLATGLFGALGGSDDSRDPRFWWGVARLDLQTFAYALLALGAGALLLHAYCARLDWRQALARAGLLLAVLVAGGALSAPTGAVLALIVGLELWLFRSPHRPWELALGALGVWLLLALAASLVAPSASFAFTVPLLFALAAHHWAVKRAPQDAVAEMALIAGALWGFVWIAHLTRLVHLALGYAMPGLPAVLPVLALGLVVPAVVREIARHERVLAATAVLAACALLVWHSLTPPWSARHPRPADLWLLADLDTGETLFASRDRLREPWQLAHVPEDAAPDSLARLFPGAEEPLWVAPAVGVAPPAPTFEVLEDRKAHDGRTLRLVFRPPAGTVRGTLLLDSASEIAELSIADRALAVDARHAEGRLRIDWHAIPETGAELVLRLRGDAVVELRTLSIGKEFAAPYSAAPERRPADAMVRHYGYGDATVIKKTVRL